MHSLSTEHLEKAFEAIKALDIPSTERIQIYNIIGEVCRAEYSQGCSDTREILYKVNTKTLYLANNETN